MFCGSCGKPVAAGKRFCGGCGKPVGAPAAAPQPVVEYAAANASPFSGPPPPSGYTPPAYVPPRASYAAAPVPAAVPVAAAGTVPAGGPMPPNLHWAVVMILSWVTFGLAGLIWAFRQAAFAKKIDPASKATMLMMLCLTGMVTQVGLYIFALSSTSMLAMLLVVILMLNLVIIIAGIASIFSIRGSMLEYYNRSENIGLRLSGVMTFFFSILYLQYHLSRIAAWKQTGVLQ